jgi:hypothetical protein
MKFNLRQLLVCCCLLLWASIYMKSSAQIGIGTNNPNASAQLDISSTNKGLLPPRMSQIQRNVISSPANGLLVYQEDQNAGLYIYFANKWNKLDTAQWSNTNGNLNFSSGNVGIGTSTPSAKLEVNGSLKYTDGNQAANKILTSDANGNASWQSSSFFYKKSILLNSVAASTFTGQTTVPQWTANYTATGGTVEIRVNHTAFTSGTGTMIFRLLRDGVVVDASPFYFNIGSTHLTMPELIALIPNETGTHTYAVQIGSGVNVDVNDYCTMIVTEYK